MRNLLIITQRVDEKDDLLGFFVDWIYEFAKHFSEVNVITLAKGNYDLPSNVHVYSLGKESNSSKVFRIFKFYKLLFSLIPKSSSVFAHMSPIFVIVSWPVAALFRKRIVLWYLHRSVTLRLKIAEKLCFKIVTAAKESLKFSSDKIIETGHGINIEKFKTERSWNGSTLRILSVGRISPIKNYETLLKSAKILKDNNVDFSIKIVGQPIMKSDYSYLEVLKELKNDLGLDGLIEFVGYVPHNQIQDYYKKSDLVIGLTPTGGIDKTILEGMASGCIVLTSNDANRKYFGAYGTELVFDYNNAKDLFNKVVSINHFSPNAKKDISRFLTSSIIEYHLLDNMIDKISKIL